MLIPATDAAVDASMTTSLFDVPLKVAISFVPGHTPPTQFAQSLQFVVVPPPPQVTVFAACATGTQAAEKRKKALTKKPVVSKRLIISKNTTQGRLPCVYKRTGRARAAGSLRKQHFLELHPHPLCTGRHTMTAIPLVSEDEPRR